MIGVKWNDQLFHWGWETRGVRARSWVVCWALGFVERDR